jgi:hypothetical protein
VSDRQTLLDIAGLLIAARVEASCARRSISA